MGLRLQSYRPDLDLKSRAARAAGVLAKEWADAVEPGIEIGPDPIDRLNKNNRNWRKTARGREWTRRDQRERRAAKKGARR